MLTLKERIHAESKPELTSFYIPHISSANKVYNISNSITLYISANLFEIMYVKYNIR